MTEGARPPAALALHIGLPKTGTTLLQQAVFRRAPGLTFVHRKRDAAAMALARRLRRHVRSGPLRATLERRGLAAALAALARPGAPLLFSDENIALGQGEFWKAGGHAPERVARRLAALGRALPPGAGPLRVILGIRRQDQWLASCYADKARSFEHFTEADFARRMARIAAADGADDLAWLDYARARHALTAALGAENVHVLPLERLLSDPVDTLARLGDFLGIRLEGAGEPALRRPRNRRALGANAWPLPNDGLLRLDPATERALRARFAESNRVLGADIPLGFEP